MNIKNATSKDLIVNVGPFYSGEPEESLQIKAGDEISRPTLSNINDLRIVINEQ